MLNNNGTTEADTCYTVLNYNAVKVLQVSAILAYELIVYT